MGSGRASLSVGRLRHRRIVRAGAADQLELMHWRSTLCLPRLVLAGIIVAAIWTTASAEPSCKVKDYYQAAPFVFACDGSGGDVEQNSVKLFAKGKSIKDVVTIPAGTQDFEFKVTGSSRATIEVVDAKGPKVVVPGALKKTGVGVWQGAYAGTSIRYTASGSTEQVTLSGALLHELRLGIKNAGPHGAEYTLGYYYLPFNSGPQCKLGGAPLGCEAFDQYAARWQVTLWAKWLANKYPDADTAWRKFMTPLTDHHQGYAVPAHHWCKAWSQWPGAATSPTSCLAAYKFVTGGGFEVHVKDIYQVQFDWAFSLPRIKEFDVKCCAELKNKYGTKDQAWTELKAIALSAGSESACDGLLKVCKSFKPVPPNRDYCLYLDADGYPGSGTIVTEDIAHCFGELPRAPSTPPPHPLPTPTPSPRPARQPALTPARKPPQTLNRTAAAPTPALTPEVKTSQTTTTKRTTTKPPVTMVVSPRQDIDSKAAVACQTGPMLRIKSHQGNYLQQYQGDVWKLADKKTGLPDWRLADAGDDQVFILDRNGHGLKKADLGHYQMSDKKGEFERWNFSDASDPSHHYIFITGQDGLQLQDAGGYAHASSSWGDDEKWTITKEGGKPACTLISMTTEDTKQEHKVPFNKTLKDKLLFPMDQKRIGLMVGGGVAGALAGGAAVAGIGVLINSMKSGDTHKETQGMGNISASHQGVGKRGLPGIGAQVPGSPGVPPAVSPRVSSVSTTIAPPAISAREGADPDDSSDITSTTAAVAVAAQSSLERLGKSDNIMVPLIALCVVCVLGTVLLAAAAYLDPCGKRKTQRRSLGEQSNSVASVQSVDTYGSQSEEDSRYLQSEEDEYDDYYEPGSSVAEFDYDPVSQNDQAQEPWPEMNKLGYDTYYGTQVGVNAGLVGAGEAVKLVVFDFDLTLTRVHMWKTYTNRPLAQIPIQNDTFVDLAGFREFATSVLNGGCEVAIATFGRKDVAKKAMSFALGAKNRIEVSSPQDFGAKEGSDELRDKNAQLQRLAQRYRLKPSQIVLVDDEPINVRAAQTMGFFAVHAQSGATREVLRRVGERIQQDRSSSYASSYSAPRTSFSSSYSTPLRIQ